MPDIYEHSSDLYDALNKKPDKNKIKELKSFYDFNKELTALEALETIKKHHEIKGKDSNSNVSVVGYINEQELDTIETELKETNKLRQINCKLLEQKNVLREEKDKYKKALEIIKNKEVHIVCLKKSHNLTHYHQLLKSNYCEKRKLTQEEYELLKEILK